MPEANFSGSSAYTAILNVRGDGYWELLGRKNSGTGYMTANQQSWGGSIAGQGVGGSYTYNYQGSTPKTITIATGWVSRPALGQNVGVDVTVNMDSGLGSARITGTVWLDGTASVPDAPYNLRRTNHLYDNSFGVSYDRGNGNGAGIEQDEVEWWLDGGGARVWVDTAAAGYSSPNGGTTPGAPPLSPGFGYAVRARSRNGVGWSGWSGWLYQTTLPSAPGNVRLEPGSVTPSAFGVAFDRPVGTVQVQAEWSRVDNGAVVWLDDYSTSWSSSNPAGAGVQLQPATAYRVRVRVRSNGGWGGWSGSVDGLTLPAKAGAAGLSSQSPVAMTVTWPASSGVIDRYDVQLSPVSDFSAGVQQQSPSGMSATFQNLTPGTVYYVRVRARNGSGGGEFSDTVSARTLSGARRFNGTAWQNCRVRRWNGSAWQDVRVRRWSGSAWQNTR